MHLPEIERVIYERNPLILVACQLQFPPILKISHQEPFELQERIRFQYPFFETVQSQAASEIAGAIQKLGLQLAGHLSYRFESEDRDWTLLIDKNSITLLASEYENYEQFQQRFQEILESFESLYQPSFYTRVGLHYQNLIVRSELEIAEKSWSELISENIAAEFHRSEVFQSIHSILKYLTLEFECGLIDFRHGLVIAKNPDNNLEEEAYLLDVDLYTEEKIERKENVFLLLDEFKKSARKLFRWSITEDLHNALQT